MRYYDVHDLVFVSADQSLGKPLIESLEFQIGHFASGSEMKGAVPYEIHIRPYSQFTAGVGNVEWSGFHLSQGVVGRAVHESSKQLAVEKTANGFNIFSDSPNFLINLYLQLILSQEGYTFVHSAAYCDKEGRATMLAGAGGVGKTALLGHIVQKHGRKHMGDDIVIVGHDDVCLSFPRAFVFKEYHRAVYPDIFRELKIRRWSAYGAKRFIVENMPFLGLTKKLLRRAGLYYAVADSLGLAPHLATVSVAKIFGENSVADKGSIERIVFLERVSGDEFRLYEMSSASMSRRLFSIIHHEWTAVLEHLMIMGAMELVDLPEYWNRVRGVIESVVAGKSLLMMQVPHSTGPEELAIQYEAYHLV